VITRGKDNMRRYKELLHGRLSFVTVFPELKNKRGDRLIIVNQGRSIKECKVIDKNNKLIINHVRDMEKDQFED
jgi:hypothetical protein